MAIVGWEQLGRQITEQVVGLGFGILAFLFFPQNLMDILGKPHILIL